MRPSRWSLRHRLVAALVALVAAASLVVGVVSVVALRGFLVDRLDDDVRDAALRTQRVVEPDGAITFSIGQAEGTLVARYSGGRLQGGRVVTREGSDLRVTEDDLRPLLELPVDGRPRSVRLGGLGDYRVLAQPTAVGAVVTGLPLAEVDSTVRRLALTITVVAAATLVLAALAGATVVRLALRPLRRVAATAAQVTAVPLDRGEVDLAVRVPEADTDPATETGQVGAALNRLLDHVADALEARQASESRVRRFVADAGHELRTPLASIRGYTEIAQRHTDELPADVVHALRRTESEGVRMSSLVDDLLLLARLDEGRPLEREEVDLTAVVVTAVEDAHAAGPDHRWVLDVAPEPVVVVGDADRLRQVVGNLLTNARVHTPAGTTVTVSLAPTTWADGSPHARLVVRDDGPGVDPSLRDRVFDRFARGDSARSRASGSTGLGLSIVAAVVAAHGGVVDLDSEPGRTEVRVDLPLAPEPSARG